MMKSRLWAAVAVACALLCAPAHAQTGSAKTPAALATETNALWPDNCVGCITPFNSRQTLLDIIASYPSIINGLCTTSGAFPIYNATTAQWVCSTAGGSGSLATLTGGPFSINPTANTLGQALNITQTGAGAPGAPFSFNNVTIGNDAINDGANFVNGFTIVHGFGDVAHVTQGGREALDVTLSLNAATNSANPNTNYVAGIFVAQAQTSDGGGMGTEKGRMFALNPFMRLTGTATNFAQVHAVESDTQIETGTSTLDKYNIKISQTALDKVSGSVNDAAFAFVNAAGAVNWGTLIQIGDGANQNPLKAAGSILAIKGSPTFAHGIDLSGGTCSTDCFKSNGYAVDGSGNITGLYDTGGSGNTFKLNGVSAGTSPKMQSALNYPVIIGGFAKAINANSLGDTSIAITLPDGVTGYRIQNVVVQNVGTTASLTAAQFGIFSATGGGGTPVISSGTALTPLTSNAINTVGNESSFPANIAVWNFTTLFFRITQVQGAAASLNVYIGIQPLP